MGTYDLRGGAALSPRITEGLCELCGRDPADGTFGCICRPCPVCGVVGRRECLDEHGLVPVIGRYPDPCPFCGLAAEPNAPKAYNLRLRWSAETHQPIMRCCRCGHEMAINSNHHIFWNRGTRYSGGQH